MKLISKEPIKKFEEYIGTLQKDDRIAIVHHTDSDGVCSGVIIAKALKIMGIKFSLIFNQKASEIVIQDYTVDVLKKNNINKLIITDLNVDEDNIENIKRIEEFADILIIDHHKIMNDINSNKTTVIKPQMIYKDIDPSYYCTAKIAYDLLKGMVDIEKFDWIIAIAVIGDAAYKTWKDFVDKIYEKYDIKLKDDIYKTELGQLSDFISYAESINSADMGDVFDVIFNSPNYQDAKVKLCKYERIIKPVVDDYFNKHKEIMEIIDNDLYLFYIKPKFGIKSLLINELAIYKYPDKTIIIVQDLGGSRISISARRHDHKYPMNTLLSESVKDIEDGNAGGHLPAAGGSINRTDYEQFKRNLNINYKKLKQR
ncbi:DHH family phosphoesterase [Nanoarchaeota archaeon]